MSHRSQNRKPLIVPTVIQHQGDSWNQSTRVLAIGDAQRVLEALIAESGIEGAIAALNSQGLDGEAYCYLLKPLYAEAARRRKSVANEPTS